MNRRNEMDEDDGFVIRSTSHPLQIPDTPGFKNAKIQISSPDNIQNNMSK